MPVLLGRQFIGKTELGRALLGHTYFTNGLSPKLDVDDITRLTRAWYLEIRELDRMTRLTQQEQLKAFISRRVEIHRSLCLHVSSESV